MNHPLVNKELLEIVENSTEIEDDSLAKSYLNRIK